MKLIVSLEQKRFFNRYLLLETEGVLSAVDCNALLDAIKSFFAKYKTVNDSDEDTVMNLNRAIPFITQLIARRGLGLLIGDLLNKKNLWMVFSGFFRSPEEVNAYRPNYPFECGLLIRLFPKKEQGNSFFFKEHMLNIPVDEPGVFLALMFTHRLLNEDLHPRVL
ncbi:hypothetical protein CLAVI_000549 [Candidatus Clavichlamydia salmonicola]|uniref:DUF5070 domain-containing protein n=1 Tax=Candidatus Clavichlamydia salmonicola TaxID=469812 RepID=UPI0018916EB3|nr:DUF5070 domain-containing protein [Candidatus Clavichlamydia salmonicola]MBF5050927.1 hypothetical protein [Candidatus Clavichlamydia salmonicola]